MSARGSPIAMRWRARSPIWICTIPGISRPSRPWSWRASARRRDWPAMRGCRNSEGATLTTHSGVRVYGNSHGFLAGYPSTSHAELRTDRAAGRGHAARLLVLGRTPSARPRGRRRSAATPPRARCAASARGASRRDARRCCSRRSWRAACSVISSAQSAARASTGAPRSCWRRPASRCFREYLQIMERPHLLRGLASSPFDAEGVATRDRELVQDGVLTGLCARQLLGAQARAQRPPATPAASTT